jgi:hypothetical protein
VATFAKRGKKYLVRWRDPDGAERGRTCPDYETAKTLAREVERTVALGKAWRPEDADPDPALVELDAEGKVTGGLFHDFLEARRARLAAGTRRHYDRSLRRFAVFLAAKNPRKRRLTVDLMTKDALETWFGSLVDDRAEDRLDVSTARLAVTAVFSAWSWGYDSDTYGEAVLRPRRIEMPSVVGSHAIAPTWAQMDAAIAAAWRLAHEAPSDRFRDAWAWRARLCTALRFLGLRVDEQVMRLRWDDFHLEAGELVVRGELGKSRQERAGRTIPLSPHFVEILAGWGRREGYLIAPARLARTSPSPELTAIWTASKVPDRVWGVPPGRTKSQVHHAFRKGFKTGLAELGVASDVRDFLVGHHRGIDDHYLDTYAKARVAVRLIPPLSDEAAAGALEGRVIQMPSRGRA